MPLNSRPMRTVTAPLALAAALLAAAPAHARPADPAVAKKILIDSVAIPTVEGRGKVPELAAYYAGVLKAAGFTDADIEITPMGETATFAATLKGSSDAKPILLLGHMAGVAAARTEERRGGKECVTCRSRWSQEH